MKNAAPVISNLLYGKGRAVVLLALAMAVALIVSLFPVSDNDTWYHIKSGEVIVKTHSVPQKDIFSYTAQGAEWVNQEWLFSVTAYFFYALLGQWGLALFKVLVLVFLAFFLYQGMVLVTRNGILSGLLLAGAFLMGVVRFSVRPHLVTYLFIAIFVFVLLLYRQKKKNFLFILPILQVLWVNMHGAFVVGAAITGAFAAEELLLWFFKKDGGAGKKTLGLLVLLGVLGAVSIVNPLAYKIYLYPFQHFGQVNEKIISESVVEWFSPFDQYLQGSLEVELYKAWIALSFVSFLLALKKTRPSGALLYLALLPLSFTAVRHIEVVVYATLYAVAWNYRVAYFYARKTLKRLRSRVPGWVKGLGSGFLPRAAAMVCYALFMIVLGLNMVFSGLVLMKNKSGLSVYKSLLARESPPDPVQVGDYLCNNPVNGNIFNSYNLGAYLLFRLYPSKLVYIDSRANIVYSTAFMEDYKKVFMDKFFFLTTLDKYSINCFVLTYPRVSARDQSPDIYVHRYLQGSPEWSLVFFDDHALVYLRNASGNDGIIRRDRYAAINPALFDPAAPYPDDYLLKCIAEYKAALARNPECSTAYNHISFCYYKLGSNQLALEYMKKCAEMDPLDAANCYNLGIICLRNGRPADAVSFFRKAIRINPMDPLNYIGLGEVYLSGNSLYHARDALQKAVELGTNNFEAYEKLGRIYDQWENYGMAIMCYKKALQINPSSAGIHGELAQAYYRGNDIISALDEFRQSIRLDPRDSGAQARLYEILDRRGVFTPYSKAMADNPGYVPRIMDYAEALFSNCLYYKAADAYREAVRIKPGEFMQHFALGSIDYLQGYYSNAIKECLAVVRLEPGYLPVYKVLGRAYYKIGDVGGSIGELTRYCGKAPDDIEARKNLAFVYANEGDLGNAMIIWKKILEQKPDDKEVVENIERAKLMLGVTN